MNEINKTSKSGIKETSEGRNDEDRECEYVYIPNIDLGKACENNKAVASRLNAYNGWELFRGEIIEKKETPSPILRIIVRRYI